MSGNCSLVNFFAAPEQFGENREHPDYCTTLGSGRLDTLLEYLQTNPALAQLRIGGGQVGDSAST